ncbi:unnamed protein product, partial [Staurois parvus]
CHPPVPPTCAQQCAHLSSAVHPSVPSSELSCATQQCHLPVPRRATYLCPAVPPTCAHHQCHLSVPPIRDTSIVLPISAAYPCHLISAAYQCRLSVPISAAY